MSAMNSATPDAGPGVGGAVRGWAEARLAEARLAKAARRCPTGDEGARREAVPEHRSPWVQVGRTGARATDRSRGQAAQPAGVKVR